LGSDECILLNVKNTHLFVPEHFYICSQSKHRFCRILPKNVRPQTAKNVRPQTAIILLFKNARH